MVKDTLSHIGIISDAANPSKCCVEPLKAPLFGTYRIAFTARAPTLLSLTN